MKKQIAIIGGGPSALLLAAFLDVEKFSVTIYEKNKAAGRKFLVAGKGGFNLTHSETIDQLIHRYTPANFLEQALSQFTNSDFRDWLDKIGIPTFVGSSKRVFPIEGIKPVAVLNAMLRFINERGVTMLYEHTFTGWDTHDQPIINGQSIKADYTVFALGGASWKVTGSDGQWLDVFSKKGMTTKPFQSSNCGYQIAWQPDFLEKHEGSPLKNIAISCEDVIQKGEAVITTFGLEGNAIYGLSPHVRKQLDSKSIATVFIDLKPLISLDKITTKMTSSIQRNTTQALKKDLKLSAAQIDLLKTNLSKEEYLDPNRLAKAIKRLPLTLMGVASINEAISTVGGIDLNSISENFELEKMTNQFCMGEMLDWDAPTGGYLLQGCTSMGVYLARYFNKIQ